MYYCSSQGCTPFLVKKNLVPRSKFTGKLLTMKLANGMVFSYPQALITVDTPFFVDKTLGVCLKKPVYDLVI